MLAGWDTLRKTRNGLAVVGWVCFLGGVLFPAPPILAIQLILLVIIFGGLTLGFYYGLDWIIGGLSGKREEKQAKRGASCDCGAGVGMGGVNYTVRGGSSHAEDRSTVT